MKSGRGNAVGGRIMEVYLSKKTVAFSLIFCILQVLIASPMASLILLAADQSRQAFPLTTTRVTIGRNPDVHIRPECESVSRMHASVVFDGQTYVLQDHGSTNGTFVNGQRVTRHFLQPNDEVRFGSCAFRFEVQGNEKGKKGTQVLSIPNRTLPISDVPLRITMRVPSVRPVATVMSRGGLLSKPDSDAPPVTIR